MNSWAQQSIFYHIYPLGFCGAPLTNDFTSIPSNRLSYVEDWITHLNSLGINAIYFGPLFESTSHGYDTADYYNIDRRLSDNSGFVDISKKLHKKGIRIVLDGVFNHVGRDFWAFRDLLQKNHESPYINWFCNVNFDQRSPYNDPFSYEGWEGHFNLVKLNLRNPDVKSHIFGAIESWIKNFDIDGLRLDVAYCMDRDFLRDMSQFCKSIKPDFFLFGETIHGDYRVWMNDQMLDSVTNYECYKGLFSSFNSKNLFEIAFAFNRQFNDEYGLYKFKPLYNFADNHDVSRVASALDNASHLLPLYTLLFTMPGIPSIYYGSEWGIEACKNSCSDENLRPKLNLEEVSNVSKNNNIFNTISSLAHIRLGSSALTNGNYKQIQVRNEQLAFSRQDSNECIISSINSSNDSVTLEIDIPVDGSELIDLLNSNEKFEIQNRRAQIIIPPYGARILKVN